MRFIVYGRPYGKARPRRGKFMIYNPKQNYEYEDKVRKAYLAAENAPREPTEDAIWINVTLVFPIPKSTPKKKREAMLEGKAFPLIRPDVDNCLKSIMDGLNGLAYRDDKQVVLTRTEKKYGEKAMTIIDIGRYYR